MPTAYKVLGQNAATPNTYTSLYTVPAATQAVCSTLAVCNRGVTSTFRIAVRPAGATLANQHFLIYDSAISQGDSVFLTLGVTLGNTDVVTVYSGNTGNLTFSLFGSEIT